MAALFSALKLFANLGNLFEAEIGGAAGPTNAELREDTSFELREDGSFELRE